MGIAIYGKNIWGKSSNKSSQREKNLVMFGTSVGDDDSVQSPEPVPVVCWSGETMGCWSRKDMEISRKPYEHKKSSEIPRKHSWCWVGWLINNLRFFKFVPDRRLCLPWSSDTTDMKHIKQAPRRYPVDLRQWWRDSIKSRTTTIVYWCPDQIKNHKNETTQLLLASIHESFFRVPSPKQFNQHLRSSSWHSVRQSGRVLHGTAAHRPRCYSP